MKLKKYLAHHSLATLWGSCIGISVLGSIIPGINPPILGFPLNKIYHFLVFGLITAVPLAIFKSRLKAVMIAACVPSFGLVLEHLQKYIYGRNFSAEDLIANNLGIAVGIFFGLTVRLFLKIKHKSYQ